MKTVFGAAVAMALVVIQPLGAIFPAPSEASKDLQACKMLLDIAKRLPPDQAAQLRQHAATLLQLVIAAYPKTPQAKEAAELLKGLVKKP
jgi:hypothetical protein